MFQMKTYLYNLKFLENNFSKNVDVQNQNSKRIVYELFNFVYHGYNNGLEYVWAFNLQ